MLIITIVYIMDFPLVLFLLPFLHEFYIALLWAGERDGKVFNARSNPSRQ